MASRSKRPSTGATQTSGPFTQGRGLQTQVWSTGWPLNSSSVPNIYIILHPHVLNVHHNCILARSQCGPVQARKSKGLHKSGCSQTEASGMHQDGGAHGARSIAHPSHRFSQCPPLPVPGFGRTQLRDWRESPLPDASGWGTMRVESFFPTCPPAHHFHFLPLQKHLRCVQPPGPPRLLVLLCQLNSSYVPNIVAPTSTDTFYLILDTRTSRQVLFRTASCSSSPPFAPSLSAPLCAAPPAPDLQAYLLLLSTELGSASN